MSRRPKFNPEISRVKLNPEQAVLQCACFGTTAMKWRVTSRNGSSSTYCIGGSGRLVGKLTQINCSRSAGGSSATNIGISGVAAS